MLLALALVQASADELFVVMRRQAAHVEVEEVVAGRWTAQWLEGELKVGGQVEVEWDPKENGQHSRMIASAARSESSHKISIRGESQVEERR